MNGAASGEELNVRFDRIARIQAAMRERGWIAIVILNHDDYRYLFGTEEPNRER